MYISSLYHDMSWYRQSQGEKMNEDTESYGEESVAEHMHELVERPVVTGPICNVEQHTSNTIVPHQGTAITGCPTNIDARTLRGKAMLVKAGAPGDHEIKDGLPLHLVVTHWLVMPDQQMDEKTGEVSEFTRVVLFDAAGRTFRTSGAGAPATLLRLLQCYTRTEWLAGIPLVVYTRPSKRHRGSIYHDIQVDISSLGA